MQCDKRDIMYGSHVCSSLKWPLKDILQSKICCGETDTKDKIIRLNVYFNNFEDIHRLNLLANVSMYLFVLVSRKILLIILV